MGKTYRRSSEQTYSKSKREFYDETGFKKENKNYNRERTYYEDTEKSF